MKIWFVESGSADNYIMVAKEDGMLMASNCAPDGMFGEVALYGDRDSDTAEKIASAISSMLVECGEQYEEDYQYMDDMNITYTEWLSEQEKFEQWQRDTAYLVYDKEDTDAEK